MTPTPINPRDAIRHFAKERRCFRRIARILGPVVQEMIERERRQNGQSNGTLGHSVHGVCPDAGPAGGRVDVEVR